MNTTERTHYDVLGVAADSPDVVIKAAYRALAKEFHPDRADASDGDSNRFIEIQEAYAILSKPESCSEYDEELRENAMLQSGPAAAAAEAGASLVARKPNGVHSASADIERICARLALYSENLAQSFHEAYLRGECGDDPWRFAGEMEKGFFRQFFGDDPDLQALARLLMLSSRTSAAMTLNKLIAHDPTAQSGEVRNAVAAILKEHFAEDKLFADWLKAKFGLAAAPAEPAMAPLAPVHPPLHAPVPEPPPALKTPPPIRKKMQAKRTGPEAVPSPKRQAQIGTGPVSVSEDEDYSDLQPESALQLPRPWRAVGLLIFWAIAIYFILFTALPLLQ